MFSKTVQQFQFIDYIKHKLFLSNFNHILVKRLGLHKGCKCMSLPRGEGQKYNLNNNLGTWTFPVKFHFVFTKMIIFTFFAAIKGRNRASRQPGPPS